MRYVVNEYHTDLSTHRTILHDQHFFGTDEYDKAMAFIEGYCQKPHPRLNSKFSVSDRPFLSSREEKL